MSSEAAYWAWTRQFLDSDGQLDVAAMREDVDNPPIDDPFVDRLEEHPGYER